MFNEGELSRRDFLKLSALAIVGAAVQACAKPSPAPEPTKPPPAPTATPKPAAPTDTPKPVTKYKEAPMLADLVKAGKLPPVEERCPQDPMAIDLPWSKVGRYGGTLRLAITSASFDTLQVYQYGHSPIHWTGGGTGTGPGLFKSWSVNADATEWTFNLRRGIKWSDGHPFTVDDIIFWWEDMVNNKDAGEAAPAWAMVGGKPMEVTKIDDFTIKFKFAASAPITDFELATGSYFGFTHCPIPAHYMKQFHPKYSEMKDFATFNQKRDWWVNPDLPVLNAWKVAKLDPGQRMLLERNPYYWCVDKEGNQLPYIDQVDVAYVADLEVVKLQVINGGVDFHVYPRLPLKDLSLFKENEAKGKYHIEFWDDGAGGAPAWSVNWNQPDPEKQEFIRRREFRLALSYAINRPRIKKMVFFGLGGPPSTGTVSPNTSQFNRSEEGKKVFQEWRDHAAAYDPEKAKKLLDQAGAVDKNGDGWRELPSGKELKFVIYNNAPEFAEAGTMLEEDWRAVGLNCVHTMVSGQQISVDWTSGNSDIRIWGGGAPDGPDILGYAPWLVSYGNSGRWAPLYGQWMALEGTAKENVDADKPPRDRKPPWDAPLPEDPNYRMWQIYKKAIREPDMKKRDQLVFDIIRIHIDEGPFLLGMIADTPYIIIVGNTLKNVPTHEEIPMGGWTGPWVIAQPGSTTYPEQYYFES